MWSHWLGLIGEGLNFFGALVMALDIFWRERERTLKSNLDELMLVARVNGLKSSRYRGYPLASTGFSEKVLYRRSSLIAYGGVALLAFGFLFLAMYHGLEIRNAHQMRSPGVQIIQGSVSLF